jgi:pyrroloquinoline-quinone synthase
MNFWTRLERISDQRSVLRHPFYVRWMDGTLTRKDLTRYAGQYRHAVVALATATERAARSPEAGADAPVLADHAREESEHIALWDVFIEQVGGDSNAAPTHQTTACVRAWTGDDHPPLLQTLAAMYAIESAQPAISHTKLDGLRAHYGIESSPYFELHRRRDLEHAAQAREMIEARLTVADEDALLMTADGVLQANWLLLDGV